MYANFVGEKICKSLIIFVFVWPSSYHKEITVPTEDKLLNLFLFLDNKVVYQLLSLVKKW
jgi:hypothetical protein